MYLIFNCGGTNTRIGISADGQALDKIIDFRTYKNFDQQVARMKEETAGLIDNQRPEKIGGGIAGLWLPNKSRLYKSPNLPLWEGVEIKKKLEEIWGKTVTLANDAEMEGLGEATVGAGRRKRIVGYLTIGTGIGGVKIEDGKICPRTYGFEPGYQIVDINDEMGYLEDFAGGAGLQKIYGRLPEEIDDPEAWNKETQLIAVGIHNAILFWSPEIIVLGGSLMQKIKISDLKAKLILQMKRLPKLPELVMGELQDKAGLYGALEYIRKTPL
jgi:glucokinase